MTMFAKYVIRFRYVIFVLAFLVLSSCRKDPLSPRIADADGPQVYTLQSAQGDRHITLRWGEYYLCNIHCPPLFEAKEYEIYMSSTSAEDMRLHARVSGEQQELTIPNLQNDALYYFRVLAIGVQDSVVTSNYIVASPGQKDVQILTEANRIRDFSYSTDARDVAYSSYHEGSISLFLQQSGQSAVLLSRSSGAPAWDPTGRRRLVYHSSLNMGEILPGYPSQHIMLYDFETDRHRQLTFGMIYATSPIWSPDGQSLVFISDQDGDRTAYELYLMNADTDEEYVRLTHLTQNREILSFGHPAVSWSPDGEQIAFSSLSMEDNAAYSPMKIYTINKDGSNKRILISSRWDDYLPVFSPDGRSLAFLSNRSGFRAIWLLDLQTGHLQQLTKSDHVSNPSVFIRGNLQWQADGKGILFSGLGNDANLYIYQVLVD